MYVALPSPRAGQIQRRAGTPGRRRPQTDRQVLPASTSSGRHTVVPQAVALSTVPSECDGRTASRRTLPRRGPQGPIRAVAQACGYNPHLSTVTCCSRSCSCPAPVLTRIQPAGGQGGRSATGLRQPFQPEPVSSLHVTFIRKDRITCRHGFTARAGHNQMDVACAHDGVPVLSSFQTITVARCSATSCPV